MNKKLLGLILVLFTGFYINAAYEYDSMDDCLNKQHDLGKSPEEQNNFCCPKLADGKIKKDDYYTDINQELCSYGCSQCNNF